MLKPAPVLPDNRIDSSGHRARRYVLQTVKNANIKWIDLWFVDVPGRLKSLVIPVQELDSALEKGVTINAASILGSAHFGEVVALPDPDSFRIFPWRRYSREVVATMFCDIWTLDGKPWLNDPRHALEEGLKKLAGTGHTYYVGVNLEYVLVASAEAPDELPTAGSYPGLPRSVQNFRRELMVCLDALSIEARHLVRDDAVNRQEIELSYADALAAADNLITCRFVVRQIASRNHFSAILTREWACGEGGPLHSAWLGGDGDGPTQTPERGAEPARRLEAKHFEPNCNPYSVLGAMLAAVLNTGACPVLDTGETP